MRTPKPCAIKTEKAARKRKPVNPGTASGWILLMDAPATLVGPAGWGDTVA
jgi:hypothetical protein